MSGRPAASKTARGDGTRFDIGVVSVTVSSACPEVARDFERLYASGRTKPADHPGRQPPIRMEIARGPRRLGRRDYRVRGDGQELFETKRAEEVLPYLEWGINQRVVDTRAEYLQIHAASMVRDGLGLILPAVSGAGKSTLAAGLLARGWQYLSDEFALIDPRTLRVHPYPKALCLKAGSFPVLERLGLPTHGDTDYIKSWKGGVRYVNPRDVRPDAVGGPAPIAHVIFPQYSGHETPRIRRLPGGRAAFRLAGMVLNRHVYGAHTVTLLGRLTRAATCYALESGALEPTCDLIEQVVSAPLSPPGRGLG